MALSHVNISFYPPPGAISEPGANASGPCEPPVKRFVCFLLRSDRANMYSYMFCSRKNQDHLVSFNIIRPRTRISAHFATCPPHHRRTFSRAKESQLGRRSFRGYPNVLQTCAHQCAHTGAPQKPFLHGPRSNLVKALHLPVWSLSLMCTSKKISVLPFTLRGTSPHISVVPCTSQFHGFNSILSREIPWKRAKF